MRDVKCCNIVHICIIIIIFAFVRTANNEEDAGALSMRKTPAAARWYLIATTCTYHCTRRYVHGTINGTMHREGRVPLVLASQVQLCAYLRTRACAQFRLQPCSAGGLQRADAEADARQEAPHRHTQARRVGRCSCGGTTMATSARQAQATLL